LSMVCMNWPTENRPAERLDVCSTEYLAARSIRSRTAVCCVLLVEFADQLRGGFDIRRAIETGASVRPRPVAMTMISTVLGGLPLLQVGRKHVTQ
jgi:Cu/Ag efflux pump CusA